MTFRMQQAIYTANQIRMNCSQKLPISSHKLRKNNNKAAHDFSSSRTFKSTETCSTLEPFSDQEHFLLPENKVLVIWIMASENQFESLLQQQRNYFRTQLKNSTASERIRKLKKLRKWIFDHQQEIRDAVHADFKKPAHEVDLSEINPVIGEINDAIAHLHSWMRPQRVSTPISLIGTRSVVHYEPKGVSLILAPWNFPFMLTISPLVSAIAAGCTSIVKPSEVSEYTTQLIDKMLSELYPKGEIAVVQGDYTVATALTALPFDHIFFTGSPAVGKKVMRAAADNLVSVTLELGGRNPVYIDASANISDTARKLIWGKFFNAGQSCMSPNYVMVHESVHDKMVAALKKAYEKAFNEDHQDIEKSPDYARIITPRHQGRLLELVQETLKAGAKTLIGDPNTAHDAFLPPTILTEVKKDHPVLQDEIFGPIMPVLKVSGLEEALELIQTIEKPLGAYIFAKSRKAVKKFIRETSSGNVIVNETTIAFAHPGLPFGGVNHSGIGKAHGYAGFLAFTNEKPVMRQSTLVPSTLLAHAPYSKWKNKALNLVMRWF